MRLLLRKPTQVLKKSYASRPALKTQLEGFRKALARLLSRIDESESAEFQKSIISSFLSESFYKEPYNILAGGQSDLQIDCETAEQAGSSAVLVVKRVYGAEMIMPLKPNVRALHELILLYFDACEQQGRAIQHLIATDAYNWFVFDQNTFRQVFYENVKLRRLYQIKQQQQRDNLFFYSEAAKVIRDLKVELPVVYVNLRQVEGQSGIESKTTFTTLIPIYKLFAPDHLLRLEQGAESQNANAFFAELLPILGVQEVPELRQKKARGNSLRRLPLELRQESSLLEKAIHQIEHRALLDTIAPSLSAFLSTTDDPVGNLGFYYCLTFFLRALGQKLLEAQPTDVHLAYPTDFIDSFLELSDQPLPLMEADGEELRLFLESYVFVTGGTTNLIDSEKPFLTRSDLGHILEKLNSYENGNFTISSSFTSKVIQDVLSLTLIQHFNNTYRWKSTTVDELRDCIGALDIHEANTLLNTLRIGDLAVGSGRLLEAALNTLIALKATLGILCDEEGYAVRHYSFSVEDDELFVCDADGVLVDFQSLLSNGRPTEGGRLQKVLFQEKLSLLKLCLYGVDSSPISLSLCRFRLFLSIVELGYIEQFPLTKVNLALGNSLVRAKVTDSTIIIDRLHRLTAEYALKYQASQLFHVELTPQQQRDKEKREREISRLEARLREQTNEIVYGQATDWAATFPALADKQGKFSGFDVLICQPPEHFAAQAEAFKPYMKQTYPKIFSSRAEPYMYFVAEGMRLLQPKGIAAWLLPVDWQERSYGAKFRRWVDTYAKCTTIEHGEDILVLKFFCTLLPEH